MTPKSKTSRKPTHAVYHVREGDKKGFWTKIGAAWLHEDGQGLNVALELVPVGNDGRLVIRAIAADEAATSTQGEAA